MDARTHRLLAELYLPLVKAYGSDEAWRICELSMQVHGGVGYLRDRPIEQYARDAKVLSIWEGANYMHAQELIREKLRRGTATPIWGHAEKELTRIMDRAAATEEFHSELAVLREALQATRQTLALLSELMSREQHAAVGHHCVRALRMLAELVIGALLLDVGLAAGERLRGLPPAHPDRAFYAGKQSAARFFVHNVLIGYRAHVASISAWEHSTVEMSDAMFGLSCQRRP